jgi:hypothetical protein
MALTLGNILTKADPNLISDALRKVNLGVMLAPVSETITLAAPATTLPLSVKSFGPGSMHVRVTAGVSVGKYVVTDSGGIVVNVGAEIGVCSLAADGLSLVFASNVTTVIVSYLAASESPLSDAFNDFV